jgi:hypothetical protein
MFIYEVVQHPQEHRHGRPVGGIATAVNQAHDTASVHDDIAAQLRESPRIPRYLRPDSSSRA